MLLLNLSWSAGVPVVAGVLLAAGVLGFIAGFFMAKFIVGIIKSFKGPGTPRFPRRF